MLLDDEVIVLNGIQKVFDLNTYGYEPCTFQNPAIALEQLADLNPELIVTDIRMPQMDGLEFSRQARQILPEAEIVILSGYDDFSYAQAAVRLGVSDYLLKPIKKEDFSKMLIQMHDRIEKKQEQNKYYRSLQEFAENNRTELKNKFFLELTESGAPDFANVNTLYHELGFQFQDAQFLLVKFDMFHLPDKEDYMSVIGKFSQEFEDLISAYCGIEGFQQDESFYFFVYDFTDQKAVELKNVVNAFIGEKNHGMMHFLAGISEVYHGIERLFSARNDCVRQILMAEVQIDEKSDANPVRMPEINLNIPYTEIENLFCAISVNEADKIEEAVEKLYRNTLSPKNPLYRDFSFSISFLILLRMFQLQNKYEADRAIVPQKILDMKNLRNLYPDIEDQKDMVHNYALQLAELIAQQEVAAPSKMIIAALDYISEHFNENISLSDVAENINISKNYLCSIFKKEIGVTFVNYVTNLRIEKAKEYLTNTDMKMYEVSCAVGYNDYPYFSQFFKKHTGMTLSEYRKHN